MARRGANQALRIISSVPGERVVSVSCPATPDYLRLARLATADMGSRAGFDYEEIDDLRIGVSELCSMVSGAADATLTLEYSLDDTSVTVRGVAVPGTLVENELSQAIVRAVVDEFEVAMEDGVARFHASKRARTR